MKNGFVLFLAAAAFQSILAIPLTGGADSTDVNVAGRNNNAGGSLPGIAGTGAIGLHGREGAGKLSPMSLATSSQGGVQGNNLAARQDGGKGKGKRKGKGGKSKGKAPGKAKGTPAAFGN